MSARSFTTIKTKQQVTNYKLQVTNMLSLSTKHSAIERTGPCEYEVVNISKVKSFTNELKPLPICCESDTSELMFTQWSKSPQIFPEIKYDGFTLRQRTRFIACCIYKKDGDFYLRVKNNLFVKYDGLYTFAVELDYKRIRKHAKESAEYDRIYLQAKESLDESRAKPRAKPRARPRP